MAKEEVLHLNTADELGRVYCYKLKKIVSLNEVDCFACEFFAGSNQGLGVECAWDEDLDLNGGKYIIAAENPTAEKLRIAKMTDLSKKAIRAKKEK